jgi:hypothetical protein
MPFSMQQKQKQRYAHACHARASLLACMPPAPCLSTLHPCAVVNHNPILHHIPPAPKITPHIHCGNTSRRLHQLEAHQAGVGARLQELAAVQAGGQATCGRLQDMLVLVKDQQVELVQVSRESVCKAGYAEGLVEDWRYQRHEFAAHTSRWSWCRCVLLQPL